MADNEFGCKLRELRCRRGFSLQKLADRLTGIRDATSQDTRGVNKSYISDLERGTKPPPSRKQIARIALALRCNDQERDELYLAAGFVPPSLAGSLGTAELRAALADLGSVAPPAAVAAPHYEAGGGAPFPAPLAAPALPEHDFTVAIAGAAGGGLYQEGSAAGEGDPRGAQRRPVVCQVGDEVCVRRYERHALTVALTAAEEESDRVAADQVKLLGQVVAFIRRC